MTYVEQAKGQPYTCLTVVKIFLEGATKAAYESRAKGNNGAVARFRVIEALFKHLQRVGDIRPRLSDHYEHTYTFEFSGKLGEDYFAHIGARRLGEDTGRDILIYTNNLIERTYRHEKEVLRIDTGA